MAINDSSKLFEELVLLLDRVHKSYSKRLKDMYRKGIEHDIEEVDLSTLLNVNREVFSSCKALVFSVKDLKLTEGDAQRFDNLPMKVLG
jgi:phosphate:Na+ symporter